MTPRGKWNLPQLPGRRPLGQTVRGLHFSKLYRPLGRFTPSLDGPDLDTPEQLQRRAAELLGLPPELGDGSAFQNFLANTGAVLPRGLADILEVPDSPLGPSSSESESLANRAKEEPAAALPFEAQAPVIELPETTASALPEPPTLKPRQPLGQSQPLGFSPPGLVDQIGDGLGPVTAPLDQARDLATESFAAAGEATRDAIAPSLPSPLPTDAPGVPDEPPHQGPTIGDVANPVADVLDLPPEVQLRSQASPAPLPNDSSTPSSPTALATPALPLERPEAPSAALDMSEPAENEAPSLETALPDRVPPESRLARRPTDSPPAEPLSSSQETPPEIFEEYRETDISSVPAGPEISSQAAAPDPPDGGGEIPAQPAVPETQSAADSVQELDIPIRSDTGSDQPVARWEMPNVESPVETVRRRPQTPRDSEEPPPQQIVNQAADLASESVQAYQVSPKEPAAPPEPATANAEDDSVANSVEPPSARNPVIEPPAPDASDRVSPRLEPNAVADPIEPLAASEKISAAAPGPLSSEEPASIPRLPALQRRPLGQEPLALPEPLAQALDVVLPEQTPKPDTEAPAGGVPAIADRAVAAAQRYRQPYQPLTKWLEQARQTVARSRSQQLPDEIPGIPAALGQGGTAVQEALSPVVEAAQTLPQTAETIAETALAQAEPVTVVSPYLAKAKAIDEAKQLDDLAYVLYGQLRSHLQYHQEARRGRYRPLAAVPVPHRHTRLSATDWSPQLHRLATVVRQQVESRLRCDRERRGFY